MREWEKTTPPGRTRVLQPIHLGLAAAQELGEGVCQAGAFALQGCSKSGVGWRAAEQGVPRLTSALD